MQSWVRSEHQNIGFHFFSPVLFPLTAFGEDRRSEEGVEA